MSSYDRHLVAPTSPILKAVAAPIEPGEIVNGWCELMEKVCKRGSVKGVGLAAPQIGVSKRLVYINCADNGKLRGYFMLNPVIVDRSQSVNYAEEQCLSFPGKSKIIARPDHIKVEYLTPSRTPIERVVHGYHARVICHEVDHLDGICRVGDDSPPDLSKRELLLSA